MTRRADRLLVGAGLALVAAAGVVLVAVFRLPAAERNDVAGFWGFALALAGGVVSVLGWLSRLRRPVVGRSVRMVADQLAEGVYGQWNKAAGERGLLTPIPVRWSVSSLSITGELAAALTGPFDPLPGMAAVTETMLRAGGGQAALFAIYAGLGSGRIVVVGPPGSGKSGSAVLLVRDGLQHREQLDDTRRAQAPVPVLFTAHGWDPTTCSAGGWLAAQLVSTYPLFQHRCGQAEADALVATGAVALVLDGLDEMDPELRPAALRALKDASFRVVVLTRSQEMVEATGTAYLAGAVGLQLHEVTGPEAAKYLQTARSGPPPPHRWDQLLYTLRNNPHSVVSRGLSTPLALGLVRDIYQTGDDVSELLTSSNVEDLHQRLIAGVLPAAYTPRPGQSKPRYSLTQATRTLTFIARQMNHQGTRDLAWWNIPQWIAPSTRVPTHILATTLAGALSAVLATALLNILELVASNQSHTHSGLFTLAKLATVLTIGGGIGLSFGIWTSGGSRTPRLVKRWRIINIPLALTTALLYGLAAGGSARVVAVFMSFVAKTAPVAMLVVYFALGLVARPATVLTEYDKGPHNPCKYRPSDRVVAILFGLVAGVIAARQLWVDGVMNGVSDGINEILIYGCAAGLMCWSAAVLAASLAARLLGQAGPRQSPGRSWRNDRRAGFVAGIVFGPAVGLGYGGAALLMSFFLFPIKNTDIRSGILTELTLGYLVSAVILLLGLKRS